MKKIGLLVGFLSCIVLMVCSVVEKLANRDPIITNITAHPSEIGTQDTTTLKVEAEDPDGDVLSYNWDSESKGRFISSIGQEVQWIAPAYAGRFIIKVKVTDENGGKTNGEIGVDVRGDETPIVRITKPVENEIITGLGFYTIKATVDFRWAIGGVEFYIDRDSLLFLDLNYPYEFTRWEITALSGPKVITVKAYEAGKPTNFGTDSVHVMLEGAVRIPKKK